MSNQLKYFKILISDKVYLNGLLAISLVVGALSLYMSHFSKVGIAKATLDFAYNSIVIGDYRTTINILDKSIPNTFQFISIKNSYTEIAELGAKPKLNFTVKLKISEGNHRENSVGEATFYYSPLVDFLAALGAILIVVAIYSFIFLRELIAQEGKLEMQSRISKLHADNEMALQVSHDIRSPLMALKVVAGKLKSENEELANLLTICADRINDIAMQLLLKSRNKSPIILNSTESKPQDTPPLSQDNLTFKINQAISDLVSEKKLSLINSTKITLQLEETNDLEVSLQKAELTGTLSNLINNSIESMIDHSGLVQVVTRKYSQSFLIVIQDNGRGISEDKLSFIGNKGTSFGKEDSLSSGSGLGLYQAKKFMDSIKGKLEILSKEEMGTMVTLHFPIETET